MLRTYVRKPADCRIIHNVMQLCRLCLKSNSQMVSIFNTEEDDYYEKIVIRIMTCVGIEVNIVYKIYIKRT